MGLLDLNLSDGATPHLATLVEGLKRRRPLHAALGKRGELALRDHFQLRDGEPNRMGWKALHFWGEMRKATAFASADEESARVVISNPAMNQKVFGGTITPKEGKFLAIPAREEAYGRGPRYFKDLHFVALSGGRGMLVQNEQTALTRFKSGKRKGEIKSRKEVGGGVFYWLVKSVTQEADARALPTPESFRAALQQTLQEYVEQLAG